MKIFGIHYHGYEKEAIELLLQIDSCRQARRIVQDMAVRKNIIKGEQELKIHVSFNLKMIDVAQVSVMKYWGVE